MYIIYRKQVEASKIEAAKDGIKVPETVEDYCIKSTPAKAPHEDVDMLDFDEDYYHDYGSSSESE
jgi:ubiquitin-conjugating enzyme E2 R